MPYAFLNVDGDVLGLSTSDVSLTTYQNDFDSTAVERIVGAPDGLITTYRAGRWGSPDWFSRKTSGDGTHLEDYTNIDVPPVPNQTALPVKLENVQLNPEQRTVVVPTPAPSGSFTWYTSKGDSLTPSLKRGEGTAARITYNGDETGTKNVEVEFSEAVYIHDGEINWKGVDDFDGSDSFSVYVKFGQTDVTPNPGGTGNCTLVDDYLIVPVDSTGDYDVDLEEACPIPSSSGPWVVNEKTEVIRVYDSNESLGKHDQRIVLLYGVTPSSMYLVRNVTMGSPRGVFEIDAYLVEWVSHHWKIGLEVIKTKSPINAVEINGLMMLFRWNATTDG